MKPKSLGYNTFEIDDGIILEFDYSPAEGDDWNEPYTPARVDIYSVLAGGVEMIDYIDTKTLEHWEETILDDAGEY